MDIKCISKATEQQQQQTKNIDMGYLGKEGGDATETKTV